MSFRVFWFVIILNWTTFHIFQVKGKLTLRTEGLLPVCLRIKHPSGAYDQILITVQSDSCGFLDVGRSL
jgi:hypothetical protein